MRTPPYTLKGCVITENEAVNCIAAPKYQRESPSIANQLENADVRPSLSQSDFSQEGRDVTVSVSSATDGNFSGCVFHRPGTAAGRPGFHVSRARAIRRQRIQPVLEDGDASGAERRARAERGQQRLARYLYRGEKPDLERDQSRSPYAEQPCCWCAANDLDPDSPQTAILVQRAPTPPNSPGTDGTVTLFPNGTFTYTPRSGFIGLDYFYYTATNGVWSVDPTVPMNNVNEIPAPVQVVINVTPQK